MKFVQAIKLVGFCLYLGAVYTGAQNLRPRMLDWPGCIGDGQECGDGGKKSCCQGLNCVATLSKKGESKLCLHPGSRVKKHCIPVGKKCNNGKRPHKCCDSAFCNADGKCQACVPDGQICSDASQCCDSAFCNADGKCQPCVPEGGGCSGTLTCCRGAKYCVNEVCEVCVPLGQSCSLNDDPTPCCSPGVYNCIYGLCNFCTSTHPPGTCSDTNPTDCCYPYCVGGICMRP